MYLPRCLSNKLLYKLNETFRPIIEKPTLRFQSLFIGEVIFILDSVEQDQTARFVQSGLILHCLEKVIDFCFAAYVFKSVLLQTATIV